jgi:hypothetical protein
MSFNAGEHVILDPPDDSPITMLRFKGLLATILARPPVFMPITSSASEVVAHYFVSFEGTELPEVWPEPWLKRVANSLD